jgi:hypothetical protein
VAEGTLTRCRARSGFQVGVQIVLPPFPFNDPETFENSSKDSVILREDIGDRWFEEDSDRLHSWGYLRE